MNEVIQCILNRRSIRSYKPEQIKDEEIQAIVQAGIYAPSAGNGQPWHITVIQNKVVLEGMSSAIKELLLKSDNPYFQQRAQAEGFNVFHKAPAVVVVSGDVESRFVPVDCAAAVENMLVAAASLKIGSCWIGMADVLFSAEEGREFIKELGIPEGYKPVYTLILGYPAEDYPKAPPRKDNTVNFIK